MRDEVMQGLTWKEIIRLSQGLEVEEKGLVCRRKEKWVGRGKVECQYVPAISFGEETLVSSFRDFLPPCQAPLPMQTSLANGQKNRRSRTPG